MIHNTLNICSCCNSYNEDNIYNMGYMICKYCFRKYSTAVLKLLVFVESLGVELEK